MRRRLLVLSASATLVGAASLLVGARLDAVRAAEAYWTATVYVTSVVIGAFFVSSIGRLSGARWFGRLEVGCAFVLGGTPALLLLLALSWGSLPLIFSWANTFWLDAETAELVQRRGSYATEWQFVLRSLGCLLFFLACAELSRRRPAGRWRGPMVFLGTLAGTQLAVDWTMSRDPAFTSTLHGGYFLAGGIVAAFGATLALAEVPVFRSPRSEASRRDGATLLFAALCFWAYLGFSQLLIIWQADLPHEARFYLRRGGGDFWPFVVTLVLLHFALPFAALLSHGFKQSKRAVQAVGIWIVVAHYLDVNWLVAPGGRWPSPHWTDAAALLAAGGVVATVSLWRAPEELRG